MKIIIFLFIIMSLCSCNFKKNDSTVSLPNYSDMSAAEDAGKVKP